MASEGWTWWGARGRPIWFLFQSRDNEIESLTSAELPGQRVQTHALCRARPEVHWLLTGSAVPMSENSLWRVSCSCTNIHNTIQITVLLHLFICCLLCLSVYVITFYSLFSFKYFACYRYCSHFFQFVWSLHEFSYILCYFCFVCFCSSWYVFAWFVNCSHNYFILIIFFRGDDGFLVTINLFSRENNRLFSLHNILTAVHFLN